MNLCNCSRCRKERNELFPMRMYVCPICGNKRCPHIEWHEYKCTHSNVPNQIGEVDVLNPMSDSKEVRFKNSILGFIIGDALGVPYEFTSKEHMTINPATSMIGFGSHPVPAGTWSDDSSMMLIIMKWLIDLKHKNIPLNEVGFQELLDLKNLWKDWFKNGYMTPYGECFDIGNQTKSSLCEPNLYNEMSLKPDGQGNGALMRVLPFAWLYTNDQEHNNSVDYVMLKTCEITHSNAVSNHYCTKYIKDVYEAIQNHSLQNLQIDVKSSGWVKDTYECAIKGYNIATTEKDPIEAFKKAILFAVNLGEDTDTVAAVTGGLVGAFYQENCLPSEWLRCIAAFPKISSVITEFYNLYIKTDM